MKTPHKHPEILKAFAEDTSVKIEARYAALTNWEETSIEEVISSTLKLVQFRIKPAMRSITLQDGTVVEWPEPMRVAPADGTEFFCAYPEEVTRSKYFNNGWTIKALKAGFCHLTEEAAQQHRRAIVLANGGEL